MRKAQVLYSDMLDFLMTFSKFKYSILALQMP